MKKQYLLITIMLFVATFTNAQNLFDISAQIKSKENNKPLEFCSVVILNKENKIVKGGITSEKGFFSVPIKAGNYKLAISFVGFIPDTIDLGYVYESKFIGEIYLKNTPAAIKGVDVVTSSHTTSIDKDIKVVTAEMRKGSIDTKEVLEKINGVSYDRYNDAIKVDNNSNVIILVDGMEKSQEYIKNMNPKRLKKVEIIRDPGGRYGLKGYAAVINVVLNKEYRGTEVFLYNQVVADAVPEPNASYTPTNNLYVSINQTVNKVNLYATVSNDYTNFRLKNDQTTKFDNGRIITQSFIDNNDNLLVNNKSMNYTFGADYYINPKHSVSFETSIENFPKSTSISSNEYRTIETLSNDTLNDYFLNFNSNSNTVNTYSTLFYRGKLSNKSNLNADLSYSNSENNYENNFEQKDVYNQFDIGKIKSNYTKLNVEFNHELSDKMGIQLGYANVWKQSDKDYTISMNGNNNFSNDYKYFSTETRNKLYGYYSYKMNSKISVKLGVAAEYSQIDVQKNKNNYMIYQPFFTMMYKANPKLSIKLKYRSYSNYPNNSQTDSTTIFVDPFTISRGNPNLAPTVIHKLSIRFQALQGLVSVEPYYHFSNNYIGQIGQVINDSLFGYTYSNVGFYQVTGSKLNFTIPIGKRFVIQNSFDIYSSKITLADNNVNSINDWSADIKAIMLEKGKMPMLILMYQRANVKNINALGYERGRNDYWLFLIQKEFFKKKMSVMFGYMLPIDWGANYNQDSYAMVNGYETTTNNDISVLKNLMMLKLTYRFNRGRVVKKTEKDIEKDIEDYGKKGLM